MLALPIDPFIPEITRSLAEYPSLVLQASPGSGKTTRVPPALLETAFGRKGEILVLEPRRLAAKYAARRVADERGEPVGETVGYQFRFENVGGPKTRLRFLTEGMLVRRLLRDPHLKGVGTVLLDEFHERHLHSDIALGYLNWLRTTSRPDLRLVVMSATLDTAAVSTYLGNAPTVKVDAPPHPIVIEHLENPLSKYLDVAVRDAVRAEVTRAGDDRGDILVFLPGMGEIRRAETALESIARPHGLVVHTLHGELSREEQDRALKKGERRKVILSTNVAETSLTIEGVTIVIDSGLHRIASYSWWSGVPALRTRPISRASAIQRAGRAGRTGPGRCRRLYTKGDFDTRPAFETPEIRRADMAQTLLELTALGVEKMQGFPWFEAPSFQAVDAGVKLLLRLGAMDDRGRLTSLGKRMVDIPAHPRLARALIEGEKRGVAASTALLAAFVSEGGLERLDALEMLSQRPDEGVRRTQQQWLGNLRARSDEAPREKARDDVAFAILTGFPDRVAKKRDEQSTAVRLKSTETEVLFSSGGSAKVENAGVVLESEAFVALDLQERQNLKQARAETRVHSLVPIKLDWLFELEPNGVKEIEEVFWDGATQSVLARSRLAYDELTLAESRVSPKPSDEVGRLLLKSALGIEPAQFATLSLHDWITTLGKVADKDAIESALARGTLYRKYFPPKGDADLGAALVALFRDKTSLRELRETDWPGTLLEALTGMDRSRLAPLLPDGMQLPGGRRLTIHYKLDQPPWVESRLQDFFGMKSGPSLLSGKLPLTIHLLAPNGRAVQVTSDLPGFWERAYPPLRKELGRKYPRHSWPENPLTAQPPQPKGKGRR